MTDEVDATDDILETLLNAQINNARIPKVEIKSTGFCLFCDEPTAPGRRWCSSECRDDWEKERREA